LSRIRFVSRAAAIALSLLVFLPLHGLWRLVRAPSPWPRRFLQWVGYSAGMRVRIHGTPLRRNVLFLANHVSWLDIMILAGASGTAFVAKAEVKRWPAVGWLAGLNRTVYVERSDRRNVRGQADALRDALASGRPVALFPEGTTEGGREVLPFRASLLASLFPPLPGVRVQPVAIDYGPAVGEISWIGDETAGANAKRVLSRRGTVLVDVHFLAAVDPAEAGDRKALAAAAQAEVVEALGAFDPAPAPL
jgi:1-acyl-sn-glycerol-3-phosphate acyltransferase